MAPSLALPASSSRPERLPPFEFFEALLTVASPNSYTDTSVTRGVRYYYYLTSINQNGQALEVIVIIMAVYLSLNLVVAVVMGGVNARVTRAPR